MNILNTLRERRDDSTASEDTSRIDPGMAHAMSVSPSSVKLESSTVRAQNRWCKTMFISDWPDIARPGMFDVVSTHPSSEVDLSIHATPWDQSVSISKFESAIHDLRVQLSSEQKRGSASVKETQRKISDHEEILSQLMKRNQKVFDVSVYITVRTATKDRTEKVAREIGNELEKHQIYATTVDYRQGDGMASASPIAKDVLSRKLPDVSTPMLGRALGTLFPFSATTIIEEGGILYGQHTVTDSPIIIDRFDRENGYNILTAGEIGSGKSYTSSLLNLRLLAKDPDTILVLIDPLDGFRSLAENLGGEIITVDGKVGLNPLEIAPTAQHILDRTDEDMNPFGQGFKRSMGFFEDFFDISSGVSLSKTERGVLSEALRTAYFEAGITSDPDTHRRDSPTVSNVVSVLSRIESDAGGYIGKMEQSGELVDIPDSEPPSEAHLEKWSDAASDLTVAMHSFRTPEYAHLAGESEINLQDAKVTYLDLQQGEENREVGLMMTVLLNLVHQRAKNTPKKVIVCIDEAHYMMENGSSLDWLDHLVRHSRHFDLSLHLATQRASDFLVNEKARTIAGNCSQKILHRLPDLDPADAEALGLAPEQAEFVRKAQPGDPERGYSQALLSVDDSVALPAKIWAYPKEEEIIEGEQSTVEAQR